MFRSFFGRIENSISFWDLQTFILLPLSAGMKNTKSKSLTFDYPLMQSFLLKKVNIQLMDIRENGVTRDKDDT